MNEGGITFGINSVTLIRRFSAVFLNNVLNFVRVGETMNLKVQKSQGPRHNRTSLPNRQRWVYQKLITCTCPPSKTARHLHLSSVGTYQAQGH